jgi:alpha-mannosidase
MPLRLPSSYGYFMNRIASVVLLFLLASTSAFAAEKTVWQIGLLDQSSLEYPQAARDHVLYQVEKGDWAKQWPGEQRTGSNYEVQFTLADAPHGQFLLKISTLTYLPRIPAIQVQINGHKGTFYLHPEVSYYLGDQRSIFDPHYSSTVLTVALPVSFLKQGQNSLVLSCVNTQPPFTDQNEISGIHYDFISLSNDSSRAGAMPAVEAQITPTIFYQQKPSGLVEIVEAFLRFNRAAPAGTAALVVKGKRYPASISATDDFGEQRLRFEVPEWTGTTPSRLEVQAGKHEAFDQSLTATRKWTIFVVPHTHVDIGYSDYQGKVAEAQSRTFDEAADLIKQYPDFRFATDGSWNLEQYLATRAPQRQEEILNLIRENKLGLPVQYVNELTGYASLETLYRSLYYSKKLSHEYKLPFEYANNTDVPTYSQAYPSILASAGVKYFVSGGDNDRAPLLSHEPWNEKSPFWWAGPDGKKILFWYSRCYEQTMFLFGLPPQQAAVYESLPIFMQAYSKPGYKLDVALIFGSQPENTDLFPETARFATTWNQGYAFPRLHYATFTDFFQYVDQHYGSDLPTYKGDMGPYWEDGMGADAYFTAKDRENQSQALSAEIMSTVSHGMNPDLHAPKPELDAIWKNLELFAEHTWTAGNSVSQPDSEEAMRQLAVKDSRATEAHVQIEDLSNKAMSQLVNEIHIPSKTLVVFNALNWKRDALVETDLDEDAELFDLTSNEIVPREVLFNEQGFVHVRFMAHDVPAVGYKCFQIRKAGKPPTAVSESAKNPVTENRYYRITVDAKTGAIQSIFDKELQRELVDPKSPYKFGQYLYVTGGDGQTRIINPFKALPLAQLSIHPAENGEYLGAEKQSWGYSIRTRSSDVNTPAINLEILLFDNQKRIEFRYQVQKDYTNAKEAVYFAFPVAVSPPKFAYATQQGWVDPSHDLFKGASLEWFSIQKWMAVSDARLAVGIVPVDAPLASLGDINRGEWPGEFQPKTSTIFSYAMNNYWDTNYRAGQGGTFTFRYVLTSAERLDPVALTRMGWESMQSVALDNVIDQDKVGNPDKPLPAEGTSFLEMNGGNIVLVDWKQAEDGNGTILRLQETGGEAADTSVVFPHTPVRTAMLCNGVEDDLRSIDVNGKGIHLTFQPHEVLTVRLVP